MLYEFHSWQNGKKSGTVYATYMIYGTKKTLQTNGHSQQDEDVDMTSSPPESAPQAEQVPLVTLSLVAEGNLTGTKYHPQRWSTLTDLLQQMFWLNTSRSQPSMSTVSDLIQ